MINSGQRNRKMTNFNQKDIGSAEQAIKFAMTIDDHFDMREFLKGWWDGSLDRDEWDDYFSALGTDEYTRLLK